MRLAPRLSTLFLSVCFCFLAACAVSASTLPVIALPNGYYLQRNKSSDIALVKRNGSTVLRGPVAAYAVHRTIVAGCVGKWPERGFSYPNETPFPESAPAKYFVLDTTTGQLQSDLERAEWKERLKAMGVPDTFRIVAPLLPA